MSVEYTEIFSEYDVPKFGIKFAEDEKATILDTVATMGEEMEIRTVTKTKRNMPWKSRTKPTGSGTLNMTMHLPENIYAKMFGMFVEGYKPGVMVYGTMCKHPVFAATALVEDEDGVQKLKAYPCCSLKNGISRSVETNGETVAEIELEIAVDPDKNNIGMYAMICGEAETETVINNWLENFDADTMCKASS